jgi:DNA polymerase-3 subunit gamma/tau
LLDQALAYAGATEAPDAPGGSRGYLTAAQVQAMLGVTDAEAIWRLVDALIERDLPSALRRVQDVAAKGSDLRQFTRQVLETLRAMLLTQSQAAELLHLDEETQAAVNQRAARLTLADLLRLIKLFSQAEQGLKSPSAQPQLPLELAVVEALVAPAPAGPELPAVAPPTVAGAMAPRMPAAPPEVPSRRETARVSAEPEEAAPPPAAQPASVAAHAVPEPPAIPVAAAPPPVIVSTPESVPAPTPVEAQSQIEPSPPPSSAGIAPGATEVARNGGQGPSVTLEQVKARWKAVLEDLRRANHRTLEALLRSATPVDVEPGNVVVLSFPFAFHSAKVQEVSNQIAVEKALGRVLNTACKVRCVVEEASEARGDRRSVGQSAPHDPVVAKALRIWRARILEPAERVALDALPTISLGTVLDLKE